MKLKSASFIIITIFFCAILKAQPLTTVVQNKCTSVKNQANTGTCWCYSTTSLVESMALQKGVTDVDISEMYTVRNIYVEKAKNYILRQGTAQFGEGGLAHDLLRAINVYGAVPEQAYTGLKNNQEKHNHIQLFKNLKTYLDSVLKLSPLPNNWLQGYNYILDTTLGTMPTNFIYNNKTYTPTAYAKEVLKFNINDYVSLTSFTHHPFYSQFILEVPDNFSNGSFYNVPLDELINIAKQTLNKGYTVLWDADVSNKYFMQGKGFALMYNNETNTKDINPNTAEAAYTQQERQLQYENLTTQDDHLMHIVGLSKNENGKQFFIVKNSWGEVGAYKGYINVSEAYFAINTISIVVPKQMLSKQQKKLLGIL